MSTIEKNERGVENTREGIETCLYLKIIREGLYGKVTFEQKPEGDERISSADGLGGEFPRRDNSISKGPEADTLGENCEEVILDKPRVIV